WKSGKVSGGFSEPVVTEKPVLLLAGELDAVTPVQWAREMHDYLPASRQLVVPGGGHGVSVTDACTMIIARRFLEQPDAALPLQCKGDG
ncbi:MAG: alpha/beta hydrolase, partial [Sedimenticolaceae bacterium]|nr:alpha/beta hydrolase [Sedimenticolaceae bacterium]